jgi:hypothetical protein
LIAITLSSAAKRRQNEGWTGLFYHDVDHAFGRITQAGKRFALEAL